MSAYSLNPKITKREINAIERELRTFVHGESGRTWTDFSSIFIPSTFSAGGKKFSFFPATYDGTYANNGDVMDWYVGERLTPEVLEKHQTTFLSILVRRAQAYQIPHHKRFMRSHGTLKQFINDKRQVKPGEVSTLSIGNRPKTSGHVMAFSIIRANGQLELKLVEFDGTR